MASKDSPTPQQAVRLLTAKAHELEADVASAAETYMSLRPLDEVKADIALVAQLLADHIERMEGDT